MKVEACVRVPVEWMTELAWVEEVAEERRERNARQIERKKKKERRNERKQKKQQQCVFKLVEDGR